MVVDPSGSWMITPPPSTLPKVNVPEVVLLGLVGDVVVVVVVVVAELVGDVVVLPLLVVVDVELVDEVTFISSSMVGVLHAVSMMDPIKYCQIRNNH